MWIYQVIIGTDVIWNLFYFLKKLYILLFIKTLCAHLIIIFMNVMKLGFSFKQVIENQTKFADVSVSLVV